MGKRGKKYLNARKAITKPVYGLPEAIEFLKANAVAKFDETVELAIVLGVDPKKSDETVRGTMRLPHGTGKNVRVAVFAAGEAAESARKAGADYVGLEELVEKVNGGWTDFDVAIATPEAMKQVRKLGRTLGPRGLMPNPKIGTVADDTAAAVEQCKAGRVEFRMDKHANLHVPFGKLSFEVEKLVENGATAIESVRAEKPTTVKGPFIKCCTVSSTMGVGLKLDVKD